MTGRRSAGVPTIDPASLPWLSVEQMIEADRLAIEEFDISLLQMMEHAGWALAVMADRLLPQGRITVLAGGGNNGGGGLCAARHLDNRGRTVEIVLASDRLGDSTQHHTRTLAAMGIHPVPWPTDTAGVVDAMVGYGLQGALRGKTAELAAWSVGRQAISLDFPTGHGRDGVSAAATLTLALPKEGLRDVTPLYLADLGLPQALWARMGLTLGPIFGTGPIVEIAAG